jgi:hypothetical protein
MPTDYHIIWDLDDEQGGNVQHVAANGLTKEDFERALACAVGFDKSNSSDREIAFGPAIDGRMIALLFDRLDAEMIQPVTAYYVEE